jgi:hypothetical protein
MRRSDLRRSERPRLVRPSGHQRLGHTGALEAFQSPADLHIRHAAATRLLREAPDPSTRLSCGVTLWGAGEREAVKPKFAQLARPRRTALPKE